jgi:cysteine desulfurase
MIYFDNNATTPIDPLVFEAMQPFLTTFYGNPSSLHRHGRVVKTAIEQARQQVASLVNVSADQVIFTSGGTEANNLCLSAAICSGKQNILLGATEHPSVSEQVRYLSNTGFMFDELGVDNKGLIAKDVLGASINADTGLISIMHSNNETGVIQNISELAELANEKGIAFHTDAVQSIGKVPVDFNALNVNLMSLSGHKVNAPKGVGAVIHDKRTLLTPLLHGGGQEAGLRPGTENVAAIVGFGKAAELAQQELEQRSKHLLNLQLVLEKELRLVNGLTVVASSVERLPNTSQILMDNIDGEMLLMQLDQKGVAISSGSACSSNSKLPSTVLKAMGFSDSLALSAIRVSLGHQNTQQEVLDFVTALKSIVNQPV